MMRHLLRVTLAGGLAAAAMLGGCTSPPQTQLHPDPPTVRYASLQHPFRGARLYRESDSAAHRWQARHRATWLDPITTTPQARWLTSPQDLADVPALVRDAERQNAILVLVAYYIPDRGCTQHRDGARTPQVYGDWIKTLVARLQGTRAVVIMEPDAIPADCFDATRAATLATAVRSLADSGHYVYLDAGHSQWRTTGETAERLLATGINRAEGFTVNVANRQTTSDSHAWGLELADLVGNREFLIDTSRNGLGPPPNDPAREDEWCNPSQQALGQPPTTRPDLPGVAALLWIKRPGESDGPCGGELTYLFAPRQAGNLIANTDWVPATIRRAAAAQQDRQS
jgi:endoglucanase